MIYEPAEDSYLLSRNLKNYVKKKSFLDMGTGSGIQSKEAKKQGAKTILAVDINKESIHLLKKQGFSAIQSNLFSKIKGKFDVIAFNPPYLPDDVREDEESKKITTGGKKGQELTIKFLKQSIKHLSSEGTILIIVSSLAKLHKIDPVLEELSLKKKIVDKEKLFMEELQLWELTKKPQ